MRIASRIVLAAGLVAGLAVTAWYLAPPRGEPAPAGGPVAPAPAIASDLAAASRVAAERGVPVLVLAGWAREHCPPAACIEDTLFQGAALERLARCCVPTRMLLGPAYPEASASFRRYSEGVPLPALFVLSPEGELLHAQVGQLFGLYDPDGLPYGEDVPVLSAEDICVRVQDAVARKRTDDARLAEHSSSPTPALRLEAAEILLRRRQPEQAAGLLLPLVEASVAPEDVSRLAKSLRRVGEEAAAEQVLRRALEQHPTARDWRRWALRLRQSLERRHEPTPAGLPDARALLQGLAARPDAALEVRVRLEVAEAAERAADKPALLEQLAWFRDHSQVPLADAASAAEVLEAWASLAQREGETALAVHWFRELLARYPDQPAAQRLKHGGLARLERSAGLAREG